MNLDWEPVPSSAKTVTHPQVVRARLPHGWLVASQVHGGYSVAFVPDAREPETEWSAPPPETGA